MPCNYFEKGRVISFFQNLKTELGNCHLQRRHVSVGCCPFFHLFRLTQAEISADLNSKEMKKADSVVFHRLKHGCVKHIFIVKDCRNTGFIISLNRFLLSAKSQKKTFFHFCS